MAKISKHYAQNPCAFIDDFIKLNELGKPVHLEPHQREILRLAFPFDEDGKLPYDTIIYSCPKKSGKTFLNAALNLWWGFTQEIPNEILLAANDREQAISRVFRAACGIIRHNSILKKEAEIQKDRITLSNGTTLTCVSGNYTGEAGSNQGLVSYDELWGYMFESLRRLWDELTPVPTRTNSIRLVTTYAGWEGESELLHELYKLGVGKDEHSEGKAERIHPELPIYANKDTRVFCYWDHIGKMPWQTAKYYEGQKRTLRPGTYTRIHDNRWTVSEETFITPELWDPCVDHDLSPLMPTLDLTVRRKRPLWVGVDAGIKSDTAAVVAVGRTEERRILLARHRIWKPSPGAPLDIEATIETYLQELHDSYQVEEIVCDPYQLHRSITTLKKAGLPIREFPQTSGNTTLMGQTLFELLTGKNIRLYPSEELRQQALHTVAVESSRGWRIAKERASRKIDAIVALAMACAAAIQAMGKPKPRAGTWGRELDSEKRDYRGFVMGESLQRLWETAGRRQ